MPHNQTWREFYAPRIAEIIKKYEQVNSATLIEMRSAQKGTEAYRLFVGLKKMLAEQNPGQYGHMRKTWANEYMCQLGLSRRTKIPKQPHQTTLPL